MDALELALENDAPEPEMLFYLGRQASQLAAIDLANEFLRRAAEAGYWSSESMERDPWFGPVKGTPEFQRILETTKRREAEAHTAFLGSEGDRIVFSPSA